MNTHHFIEGDCEPVANPAPGSDLLQSEGRAAQDRRVEIMVGDGITPAVQFVQLRLPGLVSGIVRFYLISEGKAEPIEVRTYVTRIGVSPVKCPVQEEHLLQGRLERRRCEPEHQMVCAFRMQLTAKSLELRREHQGIRLIDLLRRLTT